MDPRFSSYPRTNPSDIENAEKNNDIRFKTDLVLWLDAKHFDQNAEIIDSLKRGDKISFTGYIGSLSANT